MKKKTLYIIFGVILAVGILIYLLTQIKKQEFNTFSFPETIIVKNHTKNEMIDTVSMVILNKIMEYDEMKIEIFPMYNILSDESDVIGHITKVPFEDHSYKIFLTNGIHFKTLLTLLSHEMVHLKQYEDGRLQVIEGEGYVWGGDTSLYVDVKYKDRPYEKEAYIEGPIIKRKLDKILYKD